MLFIQTIFNYLMVPLISLTASYLYIMIRDLIYYKLYNIQIKSTIKIRDLNNFGLYIGFINAVMRIYYDKPLFFYLY